MGVQFALSLSLSILLHFSGVQVFLVLFAVVIVLLLL